MDYQKIIQQYRKEYELTQKDIADYLFVKHNTYSQYESGTRGMDVKIFLELVSFLQIDITNIFKNETYQIDHLTRLLTSEHFINSFRHFYNQSTHHSLSFFTIDIDNFQNFNDTYGFHIGDILLKNISSVLKTHSFYSNVGRISGDKFGVFIKGSEKQIRQIVKKIHDEISHFLSPVTCSVGVYLSNNNNCTVEDILTKSEESLKEAKRTKGSIVFHK